MCVEVQFLLCSYTSPGDLAVTCLSVHVTFNDQIPRWTLVLIMTVITLQE